MSTPERCPVPSVTPTLTVGTKCLGKARRGIGEVAAHPVGHGESLAEIADRQQRGDSSPPMRPNRASVPSVAVVAAAKVCSTPVADRMAIRSLMSLNGRIEQQHRQGLAVDSCCANNRLAAVKESAAVGDAAQRIDHWR